MKEETVVLPGTQLRISKALYDDMIADAKFRTKIRETLLNRLTDELSVQDEFVSVKEQDGQAIITLSANRMKDVKVEAFFSSLS